MNNVIGIYCCGCKGESTAYLTSGGEIYPHRADLSNIPFWKCFECGNYVGCHHKTRYKIRPLGVIPTKEIRDARKYIHALIDPFWGENRKKRTMLYGLISSKLGREFHSAAIKSVEEARNICTIAKEIITLTPKEFNDAYSLYIHNLKQAERKVFK